MVVVIIKSYSGYKPNYHHGHHIPRFLQLLQDLANLTNRLVPKQESLVFQCNVEAAKPLPDSMGFRLIATV